MASIKLDVLTVAPCDIKSSERQIRELLALEIIRRGIIAGAVRITIEQ